MELTDLYSKNDRVILENCTLCPRECRADRFKCSDGYCGMDAGMNISSICIHKGEEPSISGINGICNVFFAGCNLHCLYCQNHDISRPGTLVKKDAITLNSALDQIEKLLSNGINIIGFVSPSHVVPQVKALITALNSHGFKPKTVYNTNSYDKHETIRDLSGLIDVYLPDYKYVTPKISFEYSDASDYSTVALKAIKEMYYQKGSVLRTDNNGQVENGLLIRHLVLPGHADESKKVLKMIAEELSTGVTISLMSQYHPTLEVKEHSVLGRTLYKSEYESVVEAMEDLGFRNGWIQDLDSHQNYRPDFSNENPFE